jgi:DNA-binding MarR family transcriptional regulator
MAKTKTQAVGHQLLPLLEHLARVGRRAAESSMSPGGLRPRHLIALKLLSEHGPASQQGLADALSLDPSNVVGLLNELEERELITRRRDPTDRRRHIVELSPLGADELACAYARFSIVEDDLLSALSAEERATLYDLLVRAVGVKSPPCDAAGEPPPCPA